MITYEQIGLYIAAARRRKGWSQPELGRRLSRPLGHPAISLIEAGKRQLDIEELQEFAAILRPELDELAEALKPFAEVTPCAHHRVCCVDCGQSWAITAQQRAGKAAEGAR